MSLNTTKLTFFLVETKASQYKKVFFLSSALSTNNFSAKCEQEWTETFHELSEIPGNSRISFGEWFSEKLGDLHKKKKNKQTET